MSAGVLLFIHRSTQPRIEAILNSMNAAGRISDEVHSLHLVTPTRQATHAACEALRMDETLQGLEEIDRLKPNKGVQDLTAPWRLHREITEDYKLILNLETVNPDYRAKYPVPNLTLPAGSMEAGETPLDCATRELTEETRFVVDRKLLRRHKPIGLFRKGVTMFVCYVGPCTSVVEREGLVYIS